MKSVTDRPTLTLYASKLMLHCRTVWDRSSQRRRLLYRWWEPQQQWWTWSPTLQAQQQHSYHPMMEDTQRASSKHST